MDSKNSNKSSQLRNGLRDAGKIFLLGGGGLTLLFLMGSPKYFTSFWIFMKQYALNGTSFLIMWLGNGYLADWLNEKFPWTESTQKRLWVSIIATISYTFIAWILFVLLWHIAARGFAQWEYFFRNLAFNSFIFTLMITFSVSTFVHGSQFLQNWKSAMIETEKLKKEQISAMYELLKAQVNPHFLFNSLNVLSTLVHKDADLSALFINQLSKVYRYILDTREKEVVTLTEELEELDSYIFLMKIRFGENFSFNKNITDKNCLVTPLTLQMLIENALKHNEVSRLHPLSIEVFDDKDFIIIQNNLQLKNNVLDSTGLGLQNIRSRYHILAKKDIEINKDASFFTVKIPKIYENHNS